MSSNNTPSSSSALGPGGGSSTRSLPTISTGGESHHDGVASLQQKTNTKAIPSSNSSISSSSKLPNSSHTTPGTTSSAGYTTPKNNTTTSAAASSSGQHHPSNRKTTGSSSLYVVTTATSASTITNHQNQQHHPLNVENYPILTFPSSLMTTDLESTIILSILKPLQDYENSTYPTITKSCLHICQHCGYGSSANTSIYEINHTSVLFHDPSYVAMIQLIYPILITCLNEHKDRRCRIIVCQTLGIIARSAYAKIRPSTLIFSQREPMTVNRLEDEMVNDIPTALISCVLNDSDDSVASCALETIGIITLTSCTTIGHTIHEDELIREIQSIAFHHKPVYSPSLRSVTDEDIFISIQEIQYRIYENILSPRLFQLIERVIRIIQNNNILLCKCLPIITSCLIHTLKVSPGILCNMDRKTYAKRWNDFDVIGFIDTVMDTIIIPILQKSDMKDSIIVNCAIVQGIRLVHSCPYRNNWINTFIQYSIIFLQEDIYNYRTYPIGTIEDQLTTISLYIIALRAIPIHERYILFIDLLDDIISLPSTSITSLGISSGALYMNDPDCHYNNNSTRHQNSSSKNNNNSSNHSSFIPSSCIFRRPARIGLWTEIALSFFMDGPSLSLSQISNNDSGLGNNNNNKNTIIMNRADCLKSFLSSPLIVQTFTEIDISSNQIFTIKDEILFTFTSVAIQCGRRFRMTIDGTIQIADNNTNQVQDWLKLVWIILTSFVTCIHMGPNHPVAYLEEDLSLITACLASYVQLLQEFLHFVGMLNPVSSVALKLGANACPPHIIWDEMTNSADFLCKFPSIDLDYLDSTTKLIDEYIKRELRQGIPSHHMRLFIVAIAADHWVQGRINIMKKFQEQQQQGPNKTNHIDVALLNTNSAREILLSLAPKRLLSKISKAHIPPIDNDGKLKRDPIKKLALECVRVCVACIENIALIACEWRRRYGTSNESKHIVNVAVGILQGKVDETLPDELAKSVLGSTCEAALHRIQTFYEEKTTSNSSFSQGNNNIVDGFPHSDLITQQVKVKIKPLVSTTKPNQRKRDDVMKDYFMQLCRQIILARSIQCIQSFPPVDNIQTLSKPQISWYRLSVPAMPESKDGRLYGFRCDAISAWGKSVNAVSAGSDPTQVVLAYTLRRILRHDGEEEYRVTILMRAYNMTAVDYENGIRLEIGMMYNKLDPTETEDPISVKLMESLNVKLEDVLIDIPSFSSSIVFKDVIKPNDYVTWEVTLDDMPYTCCVSILPTIVYRNIMVEPEEVGAVWVNADNHSTTNNNNKATTSTSSGTVTGESTSGENDFQVADNTTGNGPGTPNNNVKSSFHKNQSSSDNMTEDVRVSLEPLMISPMIQFQPCSLVFYTDRCGDANSFRLMWFRMSHHLAPLRIVEESTTSKDSMLYESSSIDDDDQIARKIARMSEVKWDGEAIPGGTATKLWAFMTLAGHRLYCVLIEGDDHNKDNSNKRSGKSSSDISVSQKTNIEYTLHFRAEATASLYCIAGSRTSREAIVKALLPGMTPYQGEYK